MPGAFTRREKLARSNRVHYRNYMTQLKIKQSITPAESAKRRLAHRQCSLLLTLCLACFPNGLRADEAALEEARGLYLRGNYEEAAEAYQALVKEEPVEAALGLARAKVGAGDRAEAVRILEAAAKAEPKSAALSAELALLAYHRGDYEQAHKLAAKALEEDDHSLPARWVTAELFRVEGKLKEADAAYKWLVDFYNDQQVDDAESLRWIGLGAAQFARWNRLNDQFKFLINELYPDALEAEPDFWPAHYEAGLLFLEKYNQAEASKELKAALAKNPNSADVHAALAHLALQNYDMDEARRSFERALELDSDHLSARQAKADWLLNNFQTEEAVSLLEETSKLNPRSEDTLGRLGAAYIALDGLPKEPVGTQFGKLVEEVTERNPHCGQFYFTMATRLADRKKFLEAEPFFKQAIERMPQLTQARGELGLMYMRLGEEVEAEKLLSESFEIDPFNVRVSNMLKVLDVLSGYAVIETEHFIIKFDRGRDELLARYAAKYLEEEVYPELCKQFAFEPEGKSLFEIFSRARNTGGHGWFSARMVGLPYIGTVGACAGKMVALASPNDMEQKYNWARVLKHEFIHVLNLQQTNFNIPHWFTEALAVLNEGYPRSEVWNQLLAARVPEGDVFNLDTINLGFIRPKSSLDWQMAYCQAELYAEYMVATYGDDSLAKMLQAYRDNLTTADALKRCFDVEQADFERGYLEHVKKIVAGLSAGKVEKEMTPAELVRAQAADPENPDLTARLAQAQLERKSYPEARDLARKALKLKPKHQLATYVLARIHLLVGDTEEAVSILEACLDPEAPEENVVSLLAGLKLKAEDYAEAARLYQLAARKDPASTKWTKSLARVYLSSGDDEKLAESLAELAEMDADDFTFRKKLAQLALAAKDHRAAADWATQAMQIDVADADVHAMLAQSLVKLDQPERAVFEYETAIELNPKDAALRLELARVCLAAKDKEKARGTLEDLLKQDPDNAEARQLLESLEP